MAPIPPRVQTIIGVPGHWKTRRALGKAVGDDSGGYRLARNRLIDERTGHAVKLDIARHDPKLQEAFSFASDHRLPGPVLARIGSHTFCVYLIGEGGSLAAARTLMLAARGLLRAGGCAVKVESAGTAHSADDWTNLCANGERLAMLQAFVAYAGERPSYHSCGMHNLGLRDATLRAELDPHDAGEILSAFTAYQLLESPRLTAASRFRIDERGAPYAIEARPCGRFPQTSAFYNPIGVWHLTPLAAEDASRP